MVRQQLQQQQARMQEQKQIGCRNLPPRFVAPATSASAHSSQSMLSALVGRGEWSYDASLKHHTTVLL